MEIYEIGTCVIMRPGMSFMTRFSGLFRAAKKPRLFNRGGVLDRVFLGSAYFITLPALRQLVHTLTLLGLPSTLA